MAQLKLFELVDSLEPGKKAKAVLLAWDGTAYTTRGAKPVIVYSLAGSRGVHGDRGYCFLGDSERWEVIGTLASESSSGG